MVPQVDKLMRQERLPGTSICQAAREVATGTLGAGEVNLGGGRFKKRVARQGGGKSGGYRMIVAYRPPCAERVLFVFAFAKNAASTLTPNGHAALAKAAAAFLGADDRQVGELLGSGGVMEVECDGREQSKTREANGSTGG